MFFLGQRQKRSDGELSDSEDDEEEEKMAREAARATLGSKKTKGKLAKLARASKVAKKVTLCTGMNAASLPRSSCGSESEDVPASGRGELASQAILS